MELACHARHTAAALAAYEKKSGMPINSTRRDEILLGSHANDLCELTNESRLVFHQPPSLLMRLLRPNTSALYQSHKGTLATLHCMAKNRDEPALNTRIDLDSWFKLLNDLALQRFSDASLPLCDLPTQYRVGCLFEGTTIRLLDLMDTSDVNGLAARALGMMLHIMEDSCTPSHCSRDTALPGNPIRQFYFYADQHPGKHQKGDSTLNVEESFLHENLRDCIEAVLSNRDFNHSPFFALAPHAANSAAGPWVRTSWFDR